MNDCKFVHIQFSLFGLRSSSIVVITSALHAECRGFEPHLEYGLHSTFSFHFVGGGRTARSASVRHVALSIFVGSSFAAAAEQL